MYPMHATVIYCTLSVVQRRKINKRDANECVKESVENLLKVAPVGRGFRVKVPVARQTE